MINPETLAREKTLFAYTSALEQGDFARIKSILEQAVADPILERQILELNAALSQPQEKGAEETEEPSRSFSLLQGLKTAFTGMTLRSLWNRSILRSAAVVLAVLVVLFVIADALLGPAVGNIFSNIVSYAPPGRRLDQPYQVQPTVVTQYSTLRATQSVAATQTVSQHTDTFDAYPSPGSQTQPSERLIVRTGSLILVAKDTRQARQSVTAMIAEFASEGAFVVSSSETYLYDDQMPVINMALRVPVKRYDESMTRLAGLGTRVLGRQENAQDVTSDFVDVSARIEALQVSRARLLEIVKEAKNTDDLLAAEQELSRREAELDSAKATQKYLEQTAALSSISLELQPPPTSQPVTDNTWNPAVTSRNALRALLANLRGLADGLIFFAIATLPWLVVLGLLVYGAIRLFRKR